MNLGQRDPADQRNSVHAGLSYVQLGKAARAEPSPSAQARSLMQHVDDDRPHTFSSVTAWVIGGMTRVPLAVIAALFCGTYLANVVIVALLFAAGGAALGLFTGGVLAMVVGAIAGALGGVGLMFYWVITTTAHGQAPVLFLYLLAQSVSVILFALGWIAMSVVLEPWYLRLRGCRQMSRREAELIMPLVRRCLEKLALKGCPRILTNDSKVVNAAAKKRHIVINRGVYDALRREGAYHDDPLLAEELGGLIAHELWHWSKGDDIGSSAIFALAFPVTMSYRLGLGLNRMGHWVPQLAGLVLMIYSYPLMHGIIYPLWAYHSRRIEYECDRAAVRAGYRQGAYRLLSKLNDFEAGEGGLTEVLARTHPPTELRLEALEPPDERSLPPAEPSRAVVVTTAP